MNKRRTLGHVYSMNGSHAPNDSADPIYLTTVQFTQHEPAISTGILFQHTDKSNDTQSI